MTEFQLYKILPLSCTLVLQGGIKVFYRPFQLTLSIDAIIIFINKERLVVY